MQEVSAKYTRLISDDRHWFEFMLYIGAETAPIPNLPEDDAESDDDSFPPAPNGFYFERWMYSVEINRGVFASDIPEVGCCISGEIDVTMLLPGVDVPRMAKLAPYVRVTNGVEHSEWIPKGVYFVDTRTVTVGGDEPTLKLHGYDAMLKAEQPYTPTSTAAQKDVEVVKDIARLMGVGIDSRTIDPVTNLGLMKNQYDVGVANIYTMRETLGYIAAMYGGNFVMNDKGQLRLILLNEMPPETYLLVTENGDHIVFGQGEGAVRILV